MALGTPGDGADYHDESHKVTMPEDKRAGIEQKLREYEDHLTRYQAEAAQGFDEFIAPEIRMVGSIASRQIGIVYKIAIARELLEKGEVDTYDLGRRLYAEHGGFNLDRFNNACAEMQIYCEYRR